MIAHSEIPENEIIFRESASSFVPIPCNNINICHNCAKTLLISFPCYNCYGQVVYCSVQCCNDHLKVHRFECMAYQCKIFEYIGIGHLAFRTMIEGIFDVLPLLSTKKESADIWHSLLSEDDNIELKESYTTIKYIESLRMITHLSSMTADDIKMFALMAEFLIVYLEKCTEFFENLKSQANHIDQLQWKQITGL